LTKKQHNACWRHGSLGPSLELIQYWMDQSLQCHRWKTRQEHQVMLTVVALMLLVLESCEKW
jgi:hypothetical protein